jgi:hypothetical protein
MLQLAEEEEEEEEEEGEHVKCARALMRAMGPG